MNKRLLNLAIRTDELKGAAYQVMLALAWNSSSTNECSISISDLASAAHLTKRSVIRALHSLSAPDAAAEGRSILTRVRR
jgi:DNA-binding MarR family transcriptional regulator